MAQLAVTAVGGAVGAFFGNPLLGAYAGSLLGGALFGPQTQAPDGPRLDNLRVQTSSYGRPLPIVYGTMQLAGTIIWARPLNERRHKQEVETKGSSSDSYYTYTYDADFAVAIAQGPIQGYTRIYADSMLIWEGSIDSSAESLAASAARAAGIRIYRGTEDQEADPLIEADVGVDDAPAYRGTAYIVFERLQLAKFGNRIPNITVELVGIGTPPIYADIGPANPLIHADSGSLNDARAVIYWHEDGVLYWAWVQGFNEYPIARTTVTGDVISSGYVDHPNESYSSMVGVVRNWPDPDGRMMVQWPSDPEGAKASWGTITSGSASGIPILVDGEYLDFWLDGGGVSLASAYWYDDVIYGVAGPLGGFGTHNSKYLFAWPASTDYVGGTKVDLSTFPLMGSDPRAFAVHADADGVWVFADDVPGVGGASNAILLLDPSDLSLIASWPVQQSIWGGDEIFQASGFFVATRRDQMRIYDLPEGGSATVVNPVATVTIGGDSDYHTGKRITDQLIMGGERMIMLRPTTAQGEILSAIITDMALRAGLDESDLDIAVLDDVVSGYVVDRPMAARNAIDPLRTAWLFDLVESDWQIKGVYRGASPAMTIPEGDLAAHMAGSDPPDELEVSRTQDLELPRRAKVQYVDPTADHESGEQYSGRITTAAEGEVSVSLPIAMTPAEAAQLADVVLWEQWVGRLAYRLQLPIDYAVLDPADVIQVQARGRTHTMRVVEQETQAGIVVLSARSDEPSIYTSVREAMGSSITIPQTSIPGPTELYLLDLPPLTDAGNDAGIYAAAHGLLSGWDGAVLFRSTDGGATWDQQDALLAPVVAGRTTDVLGPGPVYIWDEGNSVNIDLLTPGGTLSGDSELAVLNGANAAAIGADDRWEIVQWTTATLEADGSYTLSGLLRGRLGTEHAIDQHQVGDIFVLLTGSGIIRVEQGVGEIGLPRQYKAGTIGGAPIQSVAAQTMTADGVALKPWSPVHLAGSRNSSDDLAITWVRRTRFGGEWRDRVGVPLNEESQQYEIDILNGAGAVVRTVTGLGSPGYTYTAAQQTADFGTTQASVDVRVYQISATVGRGYPAEATL